MNSRTNVIAAWIAVLVIALSIASKFEGDYRDRAQRLDLKVMTLELKHQPALIPGMGKLRNAARRMAERLEIVVLALSLSAALAAIAIAVTGPVWWGLAILSFAGASAAIYFAAML